MNFVSDQRVHATGAILAGGRSSRMGRPKHALELPDGTMMIEHVAAALSYVCQHVVMIGQSDTLPELRHVPDLRPECGPLGGIEALLASGIDSQYLVCPCDVPFITADLLRLLAEPIDSPMTAFQIEGEARFDPLPARIGAAALPVARELLDSGRRAVHELARALHAQRIIIPRRLQPQLQNINTPSDLDEARRRLAAAPVPAPAIHPLLADRVRS
jgi:molybdopterin-guanine dinucleotide biosynthesis protein A